MRRWLVLFASFSFAWSTYSQASEGGEIDYARIEAQLRGEGVVGWMHSVVPDQGLIVFTWRDPNDFFTNAQFPLVSRDAAIQAQLQAFRRHDKVRIKGSYVQNGAPQRHINVTSVELLEAFTENLGDPYRYEVRIPDDLRDRTEIIAKIHAVEAGGKILIIEYVDVILPVFVNNETIAEHVKGLYRGDKIKLHFILRTYPNRPSHLSPAPGVAQPIEVLEPIVAIHEKPADIEGVIVKFPKSPQVIFDVFALQRTDADGVTLDYTLVNFEDQEAFAAIRAKLATAFDENASAAINGRNKLIIPKVKVRARGTFNLVSPAQANPQILLGSPDDLEIRVEE